MNPPRVLVETVASPVTVTALDRMGDGGARYRYEVAWRDEDLFGAVEIQFHEGSITQRDFNGVTDEALLSIVRDRLRSFQKGSMACQEFRRALIHLNSAMECLMQERARRAEMEMLAENARRAEHALGRGFGEPARL